MADPFGSAIHDHYHGTQTEPLEQRDGEEILEHPIEAFYFTDFPTDDEDAAFLETWLSGPLLDLGAGTGRHSLYFQERYETVALDESEHLVDVLRDRGVNVAKKGDMFDLCTQFERDRFQSALCYGTQVGLAGSVDGLRQFLSDLSFVTTSDATAVIDMYDPECEHVPELLGYRDVPTPGLAHRVFHFEYEGVVGETLRFFLCSPGKFREATVGTHWEIRDIVRSEGSNHHYLVGLEKQC